MKKLTKFLTSASIGVSMSSVIFLIKDYVYNSAMKEQEIFTILIALFVPFLQSVLCFLFYYRKNLTGKSFLH